MKRRQFLQLMAATGLTAHVPLWAHKAHAAAAPDRFLVVVNASGGWDPTSICDPKGLNGLYAEQSTRYDGSTNSVDLDANKTIGDIQWSAIPEFTTDTDVLARIEGQFDNFFNTYGNRLTIINGIDTGTNNHDTGNRVVWSGKEELGYPSLAAYFAAATNPTLPMAFISNGGYDYTDSLVARARASSAGFISQLADPNNYSGDRGFVYRTYDRSSDQYSRVSAAQQARIQRQIQNEGLPMRRQQLSQLFGIRGEDSNLGGLTVALDDLQANVLRDDHWNAGRSNSLKSQAEVVVAAFKSGLAASANLNIGGFDTHGNHDANAYPQLGDLLEGVHFLQAALQYAGIANKTTVVIGSDFGRTPYYNSGNGKDHWPVTSMMVVHPGATGGKVFGRSTDAFMAQTLNRGTGLPDAGGAKLTPAHVNQALRELLAVDQSPLAETYALRVEGFNIFS
ncbi:DUF1501 domain-containing protein [Thalassolituus marinus]|uniref:DUF1501 domain-containing protein n=1 Tax=Thalassolituus marinus TaxID=671053 RepID=A0ABS7ZTB4_9GAMM|nr:DUF1501 domain-containing protein [Thalassolituus marinus]MCA6064991.1 DUF1501 domain-containing protein [Thalassolituus marinus]